MMMGSQGSTQGLEPLTHLLALVTQPEEAGSRLAEIVKAEFALEQKRTETASAVQALKAEYEQLQSRMTREADEHATKLVADRAKFDRLCSTGMAEVRAAREGAMVLQDQAKADATAAAELKEDLQRRLDLVHQAGAR